MKISVITPVYNCNKFIRQTIESVLSQTGDFELEYIIKDGGSTDGTLDILNEYKDKCIIISEKDSSVAEAINTGAKLATGDVCGILMGDDMYESGALQLVVDAFKKYPDKKWLYGRCRIINEKGTEIRRFITLYKNIWGFYYFRWLLLCENFISEPATFWHMALWKELGGWHCVWNRADDYCQWLKMAQKSKAISLRKYVSSFRLHQDSVTSQFPEMQMEEELEVAKQYGNFFQYWIHKWLCYIRRIIYKVISKK